METRAITRAVDKNGGIIMETKARKLLKKVERLIEENEYNLVKLNGISCSRADLEVLEMVLEHFINNGNYGNYMLFGEVKEVLSKNGLI